MESKNKKYTYQVIFRTEYNGEYAANEDVLFNMDSDQKLSVNENIDYGKNVDRGNTSFYMRLYATKEK